MSDTIRPLTTLLANMPVGTPQGVSAQDERDVAYNAIGVRPYGAQAATYTATESDEVIAIDCTSGAVTVNLPAAASTRVGKVYTIQKTDTSVNAIIIDGNASETIEGATTQVVFTQNASITIQNTGAAWIVISQRGVASGIVFVQTASVNVNNDNTEKTLLTTGVGSLTLPANFYRVGTHVRIRASGFLGTTGTPTQTLKVKHGSTVIGSTGALTLGSGVSNVGWELVLDITCVATGASNTLWVQGRAGIADGTNHFKGMTNTALLSVDTTASQVINITETFSATGASNTITCTNVTVEKIA